MLKPLHCCRSSVLGSALREPDSVRRILQQPPECPRLKLSAYTSQEAPAAENDNGSYLVEDPHQAARLCVRMMKDMLRPHDDVITAPEAQKMR